MKTMIGHTANNLLKYRGMRSRLDRITDWEELARQAGYKASALAQHLTTTPRQLQRYFLIKFRVSPKNWLHQIQMQEARRLLAQNRLVKEVSSDVCFGHASHFARAFKREHGTCPGTFHASTRLAQLQMSEKGPRSLKRVGRISCVNGEAPVTGNACEKHQQKRSVL